MIKYINKDDTNHKRNTINKTIKLSNSSSLHNSSNDKTTEKIQDLTNIIKKYKSEILMPVNKNINDKLDFLLNNNESIVNDGIKNNTFGINEINQRLDSSIPVIIEDIKEINNNIIDIKKLCLKIAEFTLKIDEKLSQYDIDDECMDETINKAILNENISDTDIC